MDEEKPQPDTDPTVLEERRDAINSSKWIAVVLMSSLSFTMMMVTSAIGPAILDLQQQSGVNVYQASWFLGAKAAGSVLGLLLLKCCIQRNSMWLCLCLACWLAAVTVGWGSWSQTYWVQLLIFFLVGICSEFYVLGSRLIIEDSWRFHLRTQHAFSTLSCLGAAVGPLTLMPFLSDVPAYPKWPENSTFVAPDPTPGTAFGSLYPDPTHMQSDVAYAFLIGAVILFSGGLICFLQYLFVGGIYFSPLTDDNGSHQQSAHDGRTVQKQNHSKTNWCILMLTLLFAILQALPLKLYGNFIQIFSVFHLKWSKTDGVYLTTFFYATIFLMKNLIDVFVKAKYYKKLFYANLIFQIITLSLFVKFVDWHPANPWIFTVVLGCSNSVALVSFINFNQNYIGLKRFAVLYTCMAVSTGDFLFSPLMGYVVFDHDSVYLLYVLLLSGSISLVILIPTEFIFCKKNHTNVHIGTTPTETTSLLAPKTTS